MDDGEDLPVVVVDDCPMRRRSSRRAVEAGGGLVVVGEARSAAEAVALVARLRPAVVLLSLELAGGGLQAVEQIMGATPTPVVVYGGTSGAGVDALAAGALDVLAGGAEPAQVQAQLRVAARVRVITHPRSRLRPVPVAGPRGAVSLLVIGASSGGPTALATVLGALPPGLPQAVLVVQHMGDGFVPGLAQWLDALVPMPVRVAADGDRLAAGTVHLAPGAGNLLLVDDRLRVASVPAPAGQHCVPGIDATFLSVARVLGARAVGVVLTGMGRDGAAGLAALRSSGAATYGQDEATSAVYGMPAAAHAAGAVGTQLPLDRIGPALRALLLP